MVGRKSGITNLSQQIKCQDRATQTEQEGRKWHGNLRAYNKAKQNKTEQPQ